MFALFPSYASLNEKQALSWKNYLKNFVEKHGQQRIWLVKVAQVCGVIHRPSAEDIHQLQQVINKGGKNSLTAKIVRAFGDIHPLDISRLEWQDRFARETSSAREKSVVGIQPSDMSQPIMWGIDPMKRLFVAAKVKGVNSIDSKPSIGVEIFHQEAPYNGNVLSTKSLYGIKQLSVAYSNMSLNEFAIFFKQLASRNEIDLSKWDVNWKVKLDH